ncbi:MAG TPA: acyl-CoA dehydrogenase family protein [Trebonia sp.]|jgi:alkylation response protein AidB-like acyl-CoA dehydrogenase|nr:acyl-CoA dehydrogenase family protein [Trebonia sp.]
MSTDFGELRARVRGLVARWRAVHPAAARTDAWLRSFDPGFSAELARAGLIGLTWPEEYGGAGRSSVERLVVTEELLRAAAPVAAHWIGDRQIGPAILRNGSPGLRAEILPAITSARAVFCLGMSEPEAGSDLAAVRTRARRADGGWLVSGRKTWTSHAHHATHLYLLARTADGERRHDGLTEFIIDMDSPGITVSPIVDMLGEHHFNEVTLEDVLVPGHRVLGDPGHGWQQVIEQLSFERGGAERVLSTYPLLARLLAAAPDDSAARAVTGSLLARLGALRRLGYQVARAVDAGQAPVAAAATLKYLGNAFEADVIEAYRAVAAGRDAEGDRHYREALLASPGFAIRGGAAEVLLGLISKAEARA